MQHGRTLNWLREPFWERHFGTSCQASAVPSGTHLIRTELGVPTLLRYAAITRLNYQECGRNKTMRALDDDTYPHTAPLLLRAPPPTRALTIYYITILTPPTNLCAFLSQLFCIFSVVMDRRRSRFHHEEILVSGDSPWEGGCNYTNEPGRKNTRHKQQVKIPSA